MNTSEDFIGQNNKSCKLYFNISEHFIGQNALISYLSDNNRTTKSYWRFLKNHRDIIIASIDTTLTLLDNWKNLDNFWTIRNLLDLTSLEIIKEYKENYVFTEENNEKENIVLADSSYSQKIIENSDNNHFIPIKNQSISNSKKNIEKYNEKKNIVFVENSDNNYFISIKNQSISNSSHSKKNIEIPNNHFISTAENNFKNFQLINFCYDILQELDIKSNIHPFYEILNETKKFNGFIYNNFKIRK
ncbi:7306_t:CDS:2 [Rhizophagus irregularis]|nr:7306_t:CDS:2 [Rhizophagus irregularis]